jgi:hypothetical protein
LCRRLSDQGRSVRPWRMNTRRCELCGDETGACLQVAHCEARERLIDGYRALRVEGRLGRAMSDREGWRLRQARWQRDRLAARAHAFSLGFPRERTIRLTTSHQAYWDD